MQNQPIEVALTSVLAEVKTSKLITTCSHLKASCYYNLYAFRLRGDKMMQIDDFQNWI